ncbi:dihydrolipoamide acetyltransferase family protein [Desulforhopalus singaporensis]|uniref:Dihydrolipoamide acetyltransferase component of pyruvate dehydrogenase complex n=1 Tax=Desulforhopalus singaporensis TaxID=91360 RepID=A0A1H0VKJ1_9BACT|nr:dihydrolipoamide acetyltransferase family protein [Desulforhopalus singaporensis]SDP78950.1 pyruvate dehydrogenase E2 component (dihydrolipoamide acetyltransferase) [Desulforhopalus singaporensis]
MAKEVIIPNLGLVVEAVKILKWLKSDGEQVEKDEPLLEIESDKVNVEIVAPESGVLGRILYPEESEVPVGEIIAVIIAEGESVPDSYLENTVLKESTKDSDKLPANAIPKETKSTKIAPAAQKYAEKYDVDLTLVKPTGPHETIMKKDVENYVSSYVLKSESRKISPVAQKVADVLGVKSDDVIGTGTGGRIVKADIVRKANEGGDLEEEYVFGKCISMNRMRKVIAKRLTESAFTAPHIHFFTYVEMDKLLELRDEIIDQLEAKNKVRVSINDFIVKAVALTILDYPIFNATIQRDNIYINPDINVGLAVALKDGIIVPAIPNTDQIGFGQIARYRKELIERAREGKLAREEIARGTFTVSSLAQFDIAYFTAIINPPQVAILSVGKLDEKLSLINGEVISKNISCFGLSVDHRIIDGAVAADFLQSVKKRLENPLQGFLAL